MVSLRLSTPDALELAVWDEGPRRAPATVVLTHGYAQAHGCWHHQVPALVDAGFRVLTWDLRGHGASGHPSPGGCTIEALAGDLALVVDACAPSGPLVLVGHSMGGMAQLELARSHPGVMERVVAFALVASSAEGTDLGHLGLPSSWTPGLQEVLARIFGLLAGHGWADVLARASTPLLDPAMRLFCCGRGSSRADWALTRRMALGAGFATMADFWPALRAHHLAPAPALAAGRAVLVLNGSADRLIPPAASEDLCRALPGCRHVVVAGGGHNVMMDAPELVAAELVALARDGLAGDGPRGSGAWARGASARMVG